MLLHEWSNMSGVKVRIHIISYITKVPQHSSMTVHMQKLKKKKGRGRKEEGERERETDTWRLWYHMM